MSPNIYCTNPECINAKRPIPLPYPSQPGASHHPSVWPPAYFETKFGCPECGLVSAYRKHDVNWLPSQQTSQSEVQKSGFSNVVWWSIEFWCGGENCRSRIKFQSLTSEEEKTDAVLSKLTHGFYRGNCKRGHLYQSRGIGPYSITQVLVPSAS
jgi:hypothetical protein